METKKFKYLKLIFKLILILLFLFSYTNLIFAGYEYEPYSSYSYDFWEEVNHAPQAYLPSEVIKGEKLGVGSLNSPRDIFVSSNNIYILDSGNDRIICLNKNWEVLNIFDSFKNEEQEDFFDGPRGIFVTEEEYIYVADTFNARIVVLNKNGDLRRIISTPEVIEDRGISYRPTDILVNPLGQIYISAQNVYDGLLLFDDRGEFNGFVGAPRVAPSPAELFWAQIYTEEQRGRIALTLPTNYDGIAMAESGLILTVEDDEVRILNSAGDDITTFTSFQDPQGDILGVNDSNFVDILALGNGMFSVLDDQRNRIFTYDENGHFLYVFGGRRQDIKGLFHRPSAIEKIDDKYIVLDMEDNNITIFEPTQYAKYINDAIYYHKEGFYNQEKEMWEKIIDLNANSELGYNGIGRAYFRQDNFEKAMEYYKLGNDRTGYSDAFIEYRFNIIEENFNYIIFFMLFFVIIIGLTTKYGFFNKLLDKEFKYNETAGAGLKDKEKKGIAEKINWQLSRTIDCLRFSFYLISHPVDGFWSLKHEKRGNIAAATIILAVFMVVYYIYIYYTGFVFNTRNLSQIDMFFEITSLLLPFILWCITNWCVTTLLEGKGTFKDIYMYTAYSLTPMILLMLPLTVISNYLSLNEESLFYFTLSLSIAWFIVLLFFGTLVIHDYGLIKTLFAIILIILGMGILLFFSLLLILVFGLLYDFIGDLILEYSLRT